MKIIAETSSLIKYFEAAAKAAAKKSTVSEVENIRVVVGDDKLTLTGFDMSFAIEATFPCRVVDATEKNIEFLVPTRIVEVLKRIETEIVSLTLSSKEGDYGLVKYTYLTISSSDTKVKISIPVFNAANYPTIPSEKTDKSFNILSCSFKGLLERTGFAMNDNQLKRIPMGLKLTSTGDKLVATACDGYIMAVSSEALAFDKFELIVQARVVEELRKLLPDSEEEVTFAFSDKASVIRFGDNDRNVTISSRLLVDSQPFKYPVADNFVNLDGYNSVSVYTSEFKEMLERANIAYEGIERLCKPLALSFEDSTLNCKVESSFFEMDENLEFDGKIDALVRIGMNYRYLKEAISRMNRDKIKLYIDTALKPIHIMPEKENDEDDLYYQVFVLPVRMR